MRPIDADAFSEQYGNYYAEEGQAEGFIGTVGDLIAKQPTIEPEVRHGRLVKIEPNGSQFRRKCSECGDIVHAVSDFCHYCGARMDATDTNVGGKGGADNDSE